jgi:hypothetical protein
VIDQFGGLTGQAMQSVIGVGTCLGSAQPGCGC